MMRLKVLIPVIGFFVLVSQIDASDLSELTKAATEGDSESQYQLGVVYDLGEGVTKDLAEAAKWYRMAAEQGHAPSQNNLGSLYQFGEGVEENYKEAMRWYEMAAQQGSTDALNSMAYMYDIGLGVNENDEKAVSLYQQAADAGDVRGMLNLGIMYAEGTGVSKDNARAYMWLDLARFYTQRSKDMNLKWHVRSVLDGYEKTMTRSEIKAGKKLSKQWDKEHRKQGAL